MIEQVKRFVAAHGLARDSFEFQMLYGIRRDLQRELVAEGFRLRVYVPFGRAWVSVLYAAAGRASGERVLYPRNLFRR